MTRDVTSPHGTTSGSAQSDFYLQQMELGPMENFVYLVGSKTAREVFVVDPAWQVDTVIRKAKEADLKIVGALISHYHFDHTNGIEELLQAADVPVYVNKKDLPYMDVQKDVLKPIEAGTKVKAGDVEIEMLHTPGHTPGSQCFHARGHLISGDTLFINACGRTDLPGGNAGELYHSLTKTLMKLDDATVLCPGHNYADKPMSTMGDQKKHNPYLMCDSLENFLKFRTGVSERI